MSLAGFALGAFLGTRLAPLVLNQGSRSQYAPLLGLGGALLVGAVFANVLELLGSRARLSDRMSVLRWVDGLMGAALTACVALGIAWIVGAVALDSSNSTPLRNDIRGSEILRALDKVLPPSGPVLDALARIDPLPSVHGPAATVPAPTRAILRSRAVRRAGHSVVRVYGMACGLGIEGSGWVVGPGLVVTNAHVVAGRGPHPGPDRRRRSRPRAATSLASTFTMTSRCCGCRGCGCGRCRSRARLDRGPRRRSSGIHSTARSTCSPGGSARPATVRTQNAYGQGDVARSITPLRGKIRPGNSGGPGDRRPRAGAGDCVRRDHQHLAARRVRDSRTASSRRRSERHGRGSCGRSQTDTAPNRPPSPFGAAQ